jgi:hypothetical protein
MISDMRGKLSLWLFFLFFDLVQGFILWYYGAILFELYKWNKRMGIRNI